MATDRAAVARRLAGYGRRSWRRGNVRWKIDDIRAEDNRLHIRATATDLDTGEVLIGPETPPFDEIIIVNPREHVDDGEEPNPDFSAVVTDPADRRSQPKRRKFRQDVAEAIKIELDRKLAERLASRA